MMAVDGGGKKGDAAMLGVNAAAFVASYAGVAWAGSAAFVASAVYYNACYAPRTMPTNRHHR